MRRTGWRVGAGAAWLRASVVAAAMLGAAGLPEAKGQLPATDSSDSLNSPSSPATAAGPGTAAGTPDAAGSGQAMPAPDDAAAAPDDAAAAPAPPPVDEGSVKKAYPSDGPIGAEFRDVAGEMRCPTCTGLSVLESDTPFSRQIKDIVVEQVQAGKSKDEILNYFTDRYGPWILRSPPTQGFNILAWLVPIAILVLGPPGVWFFVWRRRRVVSTFGVRAAAEIIDEMHRELAQRRTGTGGRA